jgi:hypothetical protein
MGALLPHVPRTRAFRFCSPPDLPQTVTAKALQVKTYPGCGGSWFRIADFYRFYREETIGNFWETWPDLVGQASLMPMKIAVCLCGAPQMPNIGGVHWGHTPNAEISRLYESIQGAQQSLNGSAVSELAGGSLAGKSDLSTLAERMKLLDKKMGKRVAQEDLKRKSPRGRYWAPPVGKPAAGNDRVLDRKGLATDLQKRGFNFRDARGDWQLSSRRLGLHFHFQVLRFCIFESLRFEYGNCGRTTACGSGSGWNLSAQVVWADYRSVAGRQSRTDQIGSVWDAGLRTRFGA